MAGAVKLVAEHAPAKINLFLRVVGRRIDGYHLLDSVFVPVDLADELRIEVRPASSPDVSLFCSVPELADVESNLASRAAQEFMREFSLCASVRIELEKKIPAGAGLGGGSSDAGAVLRALAALMRIEDRARLVRVAVRLGADVPFFLDPRPARVGGIGEEIAPLKLERALAIVVAVPPFGVSTAAVFQRLTSAGWSGKAPEAHLERIARGEIAQDVAVNDLAAVATAMHPEIAVLIDCLKSLGARAAAMSGSGSGVFGVFTDIETAAQAVGQARAKHPHVTFHHTLTKSEK